MNYSNIFKKQTFLIVGSICLLMAVFVGISYALFSKNLEGDKLVVKTGDLNVTFNEGNIIGGEVVPLSDADGKANGSLYSFSIRNTGNINTAYTISISALSGSSLPHQYIRISYDGGTPVALNSLTKMSGTSDANNVYLLKQGGIVSGATESHQLRVWVSNSAPSSVIGNGIGLKLKVLSEVDTSK